jgi:hypothetical protein
MATLSYRERMKAQRADASAQRRAQQSDRQRQLELEVEVRRLALIAVKASLKAKGERLPLYSRGQLVTMANAAIAPFLIAQAQLKLAQLARAQATQVQLAQVVDQASESSCAGKP